MLVNNVLFFYVDKQEICAISNCPCAIFWGGAGVGGEI